MKIKKYGSAILMIFLIIFTILLSVKHEQKRLSERMALQEEDMPTIDQGDDSEEDCLLEEPVMAKGGKDNEMQAGDGNDNVIHIKKDEEGISVCDIVRAMDFTAKEPYLEITPEENRVYLEGYLKVLRNEIPAIGEVEVKYYKDLWRAGIEFEQLLKEKDTREYPYLYYYDDLDGDGKPEFAIEQSCMFLFKYDKELGKCMIQDFEQACYFESFVGVGQIWYHDGLHGGVCGNNLIGLTEDGNFKDILRLEQGHGSFPYFQVEVSEFPFGYVNVSEKTRYEAAKIFGESVEVNEEEWNELTQPFFEMVENYAVPQKTLEEVFGDLLIENTQE